MKLRSLFIIFALSIFFIAAVSISFPFLLSLLNANLDINLTINPVHFIISFVGLILSIIVAFLFSKQYKHPIKNLQESIESIQWNAVSVEMVEKKYAPKELQTLISSANSLQKRLANFEDRYEKEQTKLKTQLMESNKEKESIIAIFNEIENEYMADTAKGFNTILQNSMKKTPSPKISFLSNQVKEGLFISHIVQSLFEHDPKVTNVKASDLLHAFELANHPYGIELSKRLSETRADLTIESPLSLIYSFSYLLNRFVKKNKANLTFEAKADFQFEQIIIDIKITILKDLPPDIKLESMYLLTILNALSKTKFWSVEQTINEHSDFKEANFKISMNEVMKATNLIDLEKKETLILCDNPELNNKINYSLTCLGIKSELMKTPKEAINSLKTNKKLLFIFDQSLLLNESFDRRILEETNLCLSVAWPITENTKLKTEQCNYNFNVDSFVRLIEDHFFKTELKENLEFHEESPISWKTSTISGSLNLNSQQIMSALMGYLEKVEDILPKIQESLNQSQWQKGYDLSSHAQALEKEMLSVFPDTVENSLEVYIQKLSEDPAFIETEDIKLIIKMVTSFVTGVNEIAEYCEQKALLFQI